MLRFYFLSCCILLCSLFSVARKVIIGGSGGYLNYANATSTLGLSPGDTIAIQPGTYSGFTFNNLKGSASKRIIITNNNGLVEITGTSSSYLTNASNVNLTGTGQRGLEYGFYFHDINNRGLQFDGGADSLTVSYARFERITDYVIRINADRTYNGTPATLIEGLQFLHLSFKKTSTPIDWGNFSYAGDLIGFGKNVEVAYCTIDSLDGGDGIRLNKVFNANIHHNKLTNTGLKLVSTHPGTIYLRGNGQLHHNFYHNIWGNGARSEGVGLNGVGELHIYNNIFLGSRKYSAIEVQTLPDELTTFTATCHYFIYNNTMGNQSARDYSAAMVDVYHLTGGKCVIQNNLGFNIEKDKAHVTTKNYIFNQQSPDLPDTSNNIYRRAHSGLGMKDTLDAFLLSSSIAIDKGATLSTITDDFAGILRPQGAKYDIGAREYVSTITSLEHLFEDVTEIKIYPNPASQLVFIESASALQSIAIQNMQGQVFAQQTCDLQSNATLNIENLPEGIYFVKVETVTNIEIKSIYKNR